VSKEDAIKIDGRVVEILANRVVRVELANGHRLLAHPSAAMRENLKSLSPGDRVMVEMSPFDLSKGCIIERLREEPL
jgi:translation initiation factor IF-1